MRMWTNSACAVLALSVLLIVPMVGMKGFDRQAEANTRCASRTQVTPVVAVSLAATVVTSKNPATYVVEPGDTLSGIAARFAVPGGWPALYAANQVLVGPDPNVIQPGTLLSLPGMVAPSRYTVVHGDTLSGIAAALAIPGGWNALYAANRQVIGPNPNVIQPGTVLVVPPQAASPATPQGPPRRLPATSPPRASVPPQPRQSSGPLGAQQAHVPVRTKPTGAAGMPGWLVTMLLGTALLAGAAFLAEPVIVLGRRRSMSRPRQITAGSPLQGAGPAQCPGAGKPRIVLADYDRLVVTQYKDDDTVYVLRPPGEDPAAVLEVARLVLPEHDFRALAEHLGGSASRHTEGSECGEPSRPPVVSDGSGRTGRAPQVLGRTYLSEACDEDLLRSDSTRAAA